MSYWHLLTIFITDPPKKSRLKTANNVSGSGHRVTSNLLQGHPQCFGTQPYRLRSSTLCQLLIVLGSSHGRSIRVQGSVTSIGAGTKKTRLPPLSPLWWVLDGWWVSGSERLTFEVLLKMSLTFFMCCLLFQLFPNSFQMSLIFGRTSSSSCAFVSIPLKHVACHLKAQAVAVSIVPNCSMKSIRTLHWKLSLREVFLGDAVEPSIKCSLKRPVAYLAHPSLNFPANGEVRAMSP